MTKLLGAIETDTLVFLCGAGLSMSDPSKLPSAARVAEICYENWFPIEPLDPALKWDIDKLSGHFHARGDFKTQFIPLVPWNELTGIPNKGHAAVADMLVSRAAHAALSANFDCMIERWAGERKISLRGALTGQEAVNFTAATNPLVKFHGCMDRGPMDTLWTQGQLGEADVQEKIESCSQWMTLNLPGRHLVVVGFWTDWGYLNNVLANALTVSNALSVTVINPETSVALQGKAADLWAKLNSLSASFVHVQASADEALEELRAAYSMTWAKRFYALGAPLAKDAGLTATPTPDSLAMDDLYRLRQDVEGKPYLRAATGKRPPSDAAAAAYFHIDLMGAGATQTGAWLNFSGRSIRVVNGAGRGLNDVRETNVEPSTFPQADIVVCAGSLDLGVPAKLIATGKAASIVSPAPGGGAKWLTHEQAKTEFGL
ncbi:SIR2 family protein [Mesorhizobium sp. M7A.F.Ca.US.011.01.1.1]|uniref:SIR2 family protein n=1 Tax=Mesorhizobium sp. M7A.F.Ca.US.011.01.1.1 TaxID=2496741 RepID=UPI000FCBD13B|nr:SIR2 family protein [Mesorhizobium sp. M7A.F.Ca.US.011.01.1.1]RUX25827.1 SIR2 family protein [Mesorhizobium sp. M7A.F.Ca.US.011.01.1.1]